MLAQAGGRLIDEEELLALAGELSSDGEEYAPENIRDEAFLSQ